MGCFNHALHNTVGDGLKQAGARTKKAREKVQYFATFAHKSGAFTESLENQYGKEITLKTDVKTRWNYQFIAAEHFIKLQPDKFEEALTEHGAKQLQNKRLNSVDRECVLQVISTLENFQEATLRTSCDKQPTVTHVLPLTLGIINYLQEMAGMQPHANAMLMSC